LKEFRQCFVEVIKNNLPEKYINSKTEKSWYKLITIVTEHMIKGGEMEEKCPEKFPLFSYKPIPLSCRVVSIDGNETIDTKKLSNNFKQSFKRQFSSFKNGRQSIKKNKFN
jgi:hypothetical protein